MQGVVTTHVNVQMCQPQITSTGPRASLTECIACEGEMEFFPVVTEGVCVHCMANENSLCLLQSALLEDPSFSLLDSRVFSVHGFFLDSFEGGFAYKPINMSVRIKEGIVPKPTKLLWKRFAHGPRIGWANLEFRSMKAHPISQTSLCFFSYKVLPALKRRSHCDSWACHWKAE